MMRKRRGIKRTKTRFEVRKGVAAKIGHRPEPAIRSQRNPSNKSHGQSFQSELNVTVKSIDVFILLWYCLSVGGMLILNYRKDVSVSYSKVSKITVCDLVEQEILSFEAKRFQIKVI